MKKFFVIGISLSLCSCATNSVSGRKEYVGPPLGFTLGVLGVNVGVNILPTPTPTPKPIVNEPQG